MHANADLAGRIRNQLRSRAAEAEQAYWLASEAFIATRLARAAAIAAQRAARQVRGGACRVLRTLTFMGSGQMSGSFVPCASSHSGLNQAWCNPYGHREAHQLCAVKTCHLQHAAAEQAALLEAGIKPSGPDSDYDPDATEDEGEDRVEAKVQLCTNDCKTIVWLHSRWTPSC